jgi:hypothetical protein
MARTDAAAALAQNLPSSVTEFDDFFGDNSANVGIFRLGWDKDITGTAAAVNTSSVGDNTTDKALGVITIETGTTTTGNAGIDRSGLGVVFGYSAWFMEWRVQLNTLSTAAQEYAFRVGFIDNFTGGDATDGVYFEYARGSSVNWRICTSNNSTQTKTNTSVAVAAGSTGAWVKLGIQINAAGTSVNYYINGVNVGNITTNIPTGAARQTLIGAMIAKSAGTTNRIAYLDYYRAKYTLQR